MRIDGTNILLYRKCVLLALSRAWNPFFAAIAVPSAAYFLQKESHHTARTLHRRPRSDADNRRLRPLS